MNTSSEIDLIRNQYKLAIDARDKLNENYHKWMTFYYVANGAILVAITALFGKDMSGNSIYVLSLVGIFTCMLWTLSCKGYYYWSNSWINIIIKLEKLVVQNDNSKLVYGAFSKLVADAEHNYWNPLKPGNISTPKLTLLFSFVALVAWTSFSTYQLITQVSGLILCCRLIISLFIVFLVVVCYLILPWGVKSRKDDIHILV